MRTQLSLALLCAAALFTQSACVFDDGSGGTTENPGHTQSGQSWTVLVYMVADNDLEPFALADLAEMAQAGQSSGFRFVVQADRADGYTEDGIGNLENWTSARRFVVGNGAFEDQGDLGEANMGAPQTLADFIQWGMRSYPADRYALVFWDHGAAWPGFGADQSTADFDHLSVAEMKSGIASGLQQAGGSHFALIGFDACLMSSWELAEALKPYSEYLLASEELEPGHGWDWSAFDVAVADPSVNPVTLGRSVIDRFYAQAQQYETDSKVTLALTDLYALGELEQGVDTLAAEAQRQLDTGAVTLGRGLDQSLGFNRTPDPAQSANMVDLGDLVSHLAGADGRFATAQQQIQSGLQKAIVYRTSGTVTSAATGLSIYFPPYVSLYRPDYDQLAEVANWRGFLEAYYSEGQQAAAPEFLNPGKIAEASIENGIFSIRGTLAPGSQASIATAEILYGLRLDSGEIVVLGDSTAAYDATTVGAGWDLSILTVTQGSKQGYVYLSVTDSGQGQSAAAIPFAYLAPGAPAEEYCVRELVFTSDGTRLQDRYYLISDAGVGELTPAAGSTLEPLVQVIDTEGNAGWAYGGDPMDATQAITLGSAILNSGAQAFAALDIRDSADRGDTVSALVTVP